MLDEIISICSPKNGGTFVDCTFGGGGYSKTILQYSGTKVIALDRDKFVTNISKILEEKYPNRFSFHQRKFSEIDKIITEKKVDAVIFDLGLSSIQLNNLSRGFSFHSKEKIGYVNGLINPFSRDSCK